MLANRFRSLIIPMVIWNLAMIAVIAAAYALGFKWYFRAHFDGYNALDWANQVFSVTQRPANAPLGYLRDLFVCIALAPVLIASLRAAATLTLVAITVLVFTDSVVLRFLLWPDILLYFSLGIALSLRGYDPAQLERYAIVFVPAGLAAMAATVLAQREQVLHGASLPHLMTVTSLALACTLWWLAGRLKDTQLGRRIATWEPYCFTVFCSHVIVMTVLWAPWKLFVGDYYSPLYPLFFLAAPILTFPAAWLILEILRHAPRWIARAFTGGRGLQPLAPAFAGASTKPAE